MVVLISSILVYIYRPVPSKTDTTNSNGNSSSIFQCEEGEGYNTSQGECRKCPAGHQVLIIDGNRFNCVRCPIGTYNPRTGVEKCTPCGEGMTTSSVGTRHASSCYNIPS